ncbi:MAG TPA: PRC-barrel domain-containing protein [Candidatus Saccharibacteria bacterium]|nr:PRC-barrel domain-containing protein [Candidatus Saccharibacteria bacterium]
MLLLGDRLLGTPVMSLQVGVKVAETIEPVIDPRDLIIVAYEVDGPLLETHPKFIRIADIRELSDIGMIIDSSDELVELDDVIKIKEIRGLSFKLIGMKVVDERGRRLGKVEDYIVDTDNFVIQQLSVKGGIINSLSSTGHLINRSQITEISDTIITVKSTEAKLTSLETKGDIHRTYNNPFRKPTSTQPETTTVD